ncbi:MAG: hypothetical protein ABSG43_24685 [Solirubrobacteraceae bacterium]
MLDAMLGSLGAPRDRLAIGQSRRARTDRLGKPFTNGDIRVAMDHVVTLKRRRRQRVIPRPSALTLAVERIKDHDRALQSRFEQRCVIAGAHSAYPTASGAVRPLHGRSDKQNGVETFWPHTLHAIRSAWSADPLFERDLAGVQHLWRASGWSALENGLRSVPRSFRCVRRDSGRSRRAEPSGQLHFVFAADCRLRVKLSSRQSFSDVGLGVAPVGPPAQAKRSQSDPY